VKRQRGGKSVIESDPTVFTRIAVKKRVTQAAGVMTPPTHGEWHAAR
jgi:hypothetical protein